MRPDPDNDKIKSENEAASKASFDKMFKIHNLAGDMIDYFAPIEDRHRDQVNSLSAALNRSNKELKESKAAHLKALKAKEKATEEAQETRKNNEKLNSDLEKAKNLLMGLQADLKKAQADHQKVDSERQQALDRIKEVEDENKELMKLNAELKETVHDGAADAELQQQILQLKTVLDEEQEDKAMMAKDMEAQFDEFVLTNAELRAKVSQLKSENERERTNAAGIAANTLAVLKADITTLMTHPELTESETNKFEMILEEIERFTKAADENLETLGKTIEENRVGAEKDFGALLDRYKHLFQQRQDKTLASDELPNLSVLDEDSSKRIEELEATARYNHEQWQKAYSSAQEANVAAGIFAEQLKKAQAENEELTAEGNHDAHCLLTCCLVEKLDAEREDEAEHRKKILASRDEDVRDLETAVQQAEKDSENFITQRTKYVCSYLISQMPSPRSSKQKHQPYR